MKVPEVLVLPGIGSPEVETYKSVYGILGAEACGRGYSFTCLSYKGCGHLVEGKLEGEILLHAAAQLVMPKVQHLRQGSMLICRSFGCLLPGYLALFRNLDLKHLTRICLWGPVPYHEMWKLYGTPDRLASRRPLAAAKGARLSDSFFSSLVPLEICCEGLRDVEVVIGVGTDDRYSSPQFAEFLGSLIRTAGNKSVSVRVVQSAPHEVSADVSKTIRRNYLDALFA